MINKQLLIFILVVSLSLQLKINHDQMSYRLGTNYGGGSNTETINNCDSKPQTTIESQPIFDPVPVRPIIITCVQPRVFSPSTNTCQCLSQTVFDPQSNQCLCPPQKPLWNGRQCVKCSENMYFDPEQRQCYVCPEGFVHTLAFGNKSRCDSTY